MLDIQLDKNYKLASDSNNFILQKVGEGQGEKNKGDTTITPIGYYTSLESLLKGYKGLSIRESNATTVKELLEVLKNIDKKIENILGGI